MIADRAIADFGFWKVNKREREAPSEHVNSISDYSKFSEWPKVVSDTTSEYPEYSKVVTDSHLENPKRSNVVSGTVWEKSEGSRADSDSIWLSASLTFRVQGVINVYFQHPPLRDLGFWKQETAISNGSIFMS